MKVLFLAHRIPYPPDKGDKIRSYHELRALAERGHQVHLLSFADDPRDVLHQPALAELCVAADVLPLDRRRAALRAFGALFGREPLSFAHFRSAAMRRRVQHALATTHFAAIVAYCAPMTQYVPQRFAARTVVDLVDVDSEKWRAYARHRRPPSAWLYQLEARRLRPAECDAVQRFARTVVSTPREAALLTEVDEHVRRERLRTIVNGVDLDRFRPYSHQGADAQSLRLLAPYTHLGVAVPRLVFVGTMDYFPNVDGACFFANEVLPLVRAVEPTAELLVVGRNPTATVRRLAALSGVTVTGAVEDVRPFLAMATACVVPLRIARGVQNKLLEAMACGRAVVATPEATSGLHVRDGEHLLLGRSASELAEATLRLLRDEHLRAHLGVRARQLVEAEHSWAQFSTQFVGLVESVAASQDGRAHAGCWRSDAAPGTSRSAPL